MITCPKCRKENQDHYKFCLGCGSELPRDAAQKPVFQKRTPPHGVPRASSPPAASAQAGPMPSVPRPISSAAAPAVQPAQQPAAQQPAVQPAPAPAPPRPAEPAPQPPRPQVQAAPPQPAAAPSGSVTCPQCGHVNSVGFKFCASCGFKLPKEAAAPAAAAVAPAAAPAMPWKLTVLRADGSDAGTFDLPSETLTVGRDLGGIFSGDSYLSPRHARFTHRGGQLFVLDEGSINGTYIKLKRDVPEPLYDGQMFRIGQEIIRYESLKPTAPTADGVEVMGSPSTGYVGRIVLITGRESNGNAFPIPATGVHIGRERGHILFPEDGYVSGLHCSITISGEDISLTDLGSSNGSFARIHQEHEVQDGDTLLMGQQLFRVHH